MISQRVEIDNISYDVHYDHYTAFWSGLSAGAWEPEMIGLMKLLVKPTTLFFDVGTWMGPTALYAAALGAEVYAFEPDPVAYRRFIRNLSRNPSLRPLVHAHNAACGTEPGTITLYADALGNSETSVLDTRNHVLDDASKLIRFEADVIDLNAVIRGCYARSREVFIKVDIEGAEFALVPKMAETFRGLNRAVINISTHSFNLKDPDASAQTDRRIKAKEEILNAFSGLHWFVWEDGKLDRIDEGAVRDHAINDPDGPDVFTVATYDLLNVPAE